MSAFGIPQQQGYLLQHNFRIAGVDPGISSIDGTPARVHALLIRIHPLEIIGDKLTNSDGTYEFTGLDPDARYLVIGRDKTGEHNCAAMDHITPAALPE